MKNKIVYVPFEEVFAQLVELAKKYNFTNLETIKWIVVKVLRLKRSQFNSIVRVGEPHIEAMKKALVRHVSGETLGRIFGFIEFHGNFFNVTENVFDPRLSTEALVDAVLKSPKSSTGRIIDLCTGSGCVAITLSKELSRSVDAVDISPFALEIAKENNEKIGAEVNFFEMDINESWDYVLKNKYDIIVSNPPYWNAKKILENKNVITDNPLNGFDGGEDGLHFIEVIIEMAPKFLNDCGELFLEIDPDQENNVKKLLALNFENVKTYLDYRGITRVISGKVKTK